LSEESPALPIPSYPALCRKDTTSWNDGRPRTHYEPERALGGLGGGLRAIRKSRGRSSTW
jgi:hypothetical protein